MEKYNTQKSKELYEELKNYLVGGVTSSFHINALEEYPIAMSHGKGSRVFDIDGNEYIDYIGTFGPSILGFSPDVVNKAVAEQLEKASHLGTPTYNLLTLSKKICEIIPCAEKVIYQTSGTEANMAAFRVARHYTGKQKIVKFEGQYHGWADEQKISITVDSPEEAGEYDNPARIFTTKGQRTATCDDIIIMPWNDLEILEKLFEEQADEIAAVITEPFMIDDGPIPPAEGYLEGLRELTAKYGILLIFDEVITGFRLALGGAQEYFGVVPDMAVFGKAVAGSQPLSLVCGKEEIMSAGYLPSGTFNAMPCSVAAAIATIDELSKPGVYEHMQKMSDMLAEGLIAAGKKHGVKVYCSGHGGFCIFEIGIDTPAKNMRDFHERADVAGYNKIVYIARSYGLRFMYERGRTYLSAYHTEEDIKKTIEIMDVVFEEFAKGE